jgi:cyclopropane-fatty-acyl-phospholipid synthase
MRRRLAGLEFGTLQVSDPWGRWQVGDSDGAAVQIVVKSAAFYRDVALGGSLGAARAWMDGRWNCDDLTAVFALLVRNTRLMDRMEGGLSFVGNAVDAIRHRLRPNSRTGSRRNIHAHYDLGNDFFTTFLDDTMTYSSGVFTGESCTLREASVEKLDRICRKLELTPGDRVVEIGCGWGSFAIHAATHYGCHVTATTISREQFDEARRRVADHGLDDRVQVVLEDYRDMKGSFDKLVSIEMIEAVGHEFLPQYFEKCASLLKPDGAMVIQAITMPDHRYAQYLRSSDFIRSYVFPGSCVPSLAAVLDAVGASSDLELVHREAFGLDYARTLREWHNNFESRADRVRALGYPERFLRLWRYYLSYCEAGFAERYTDVVHLLFEKPQRRAISTPERLAEEPPGGDR